MRLYRTSTGHVRPDKPDILRCLSGFVRAWSGHPVRICPGCPVCPVSVSGQNWAQSQPQNRSFNPKMWRERRLVRS
jgi:hypothetical protein